MVKILSGGGQLYY